MTTQRACRAMRRVAALVMLTALCCAMLPGGASAQALSPAGQTGYTQQNVDNTAYVKRGSLFYPALTCDIACAAGTVHQLASGGFAYPYEQTNAIPQVNLINGDSLVFFETQFATCKLYAVAQEYFCFPVEMQQTQATYMDLGTRFLSTSFGLSYVERVNGTAISSYYDASALLARAGCSLLRLSSDRGSIITGPDSVLLSLGAAVGASIQDDYILLDAKYYAFGASYACMAQRTQDRYITIDLSGLPSGRYVLQYEGSRKGLYLIDIVSAATGYYGGTGGAYGGSGGVYGGDSGGEPWYDYVQSQPYSQYPAWPTTPPYAYPTTPPYFATMAPAGQVEIWGYVIEQLATRTGPSTKYEGGGTYKDTLNTWVKVLGRAWDDVNEIWWVKVEIPFSGEKRVLWTGYKRFDNTTLPLEAIPIDPYY